MHGELAAALGAALSVLGAGCAADELAEPVGERTSELGVAPGSWCRGILPGSPTPPNLLFSEASSEVYASPAEPGADFGPVSFGDGDGRGTTWITDDPLTAPNEELESLCRNSGVLAAEPLVGRCNGKLVDKDPDIDVTVGCMTTRYVRGASCQPSALIDDDANPSTPAVVPPEARVYRRGYTYGDANGSPTDVRAFARPSDAAGQRVAWNDARVRVRINPRAIAESGPNDQGFSLYGRYVSADDHYFAQVRRKAQATTCDSGFVNCDAAGNVEEVQAELRIGEKLCGGPTLTLASVNMYLVNNVWYDFEFTTKGSELYATVSWTSPGGFPYTKQVRVDLAAESTMDRRRASASIPDDLPVEEYPAPIPAGTTGLSVIGIAAYFDDWSAQAPNATVCPNGEALTPLYVDDDVDFFGAGSAADLCPSWGYSAVGGDCNDFLRAYRPNAPEPCGYADYNCDGVVTPLASCAQPEPAPVRVGEGDGLAIDDATLAENRLVARINGAVVPGALTYSVDPTSPRADHEVVSLTTNGLGGRYEIERSSLTPALSFCDETQPYLVPDNPAIPGFDGVPNLKYVPKIALRVTGETHARDLSLYLGDANLANTYRLKLRSGQSEVYLTDDDWNALSVSLENPLSPPTGKPDPCNIRRWKLRVVDDGAASVTVAIDAFSKVPRSTTYPQGVVSVTFDDGFISTRSYALDCLAGRSASCLVQGGSSAALPATIYPIISALGTVLPEEGDVFMSEAQLGELVSEGWDVGVHAFDQNIHSETYTKMDAAVGEADMMAARQWLFEKFGPNSGYDQFAYPKGEFTVNTPGEFTEAVDLTRNVFSSARTINWQLRELPEPSDLHKLRVRYVTRVTTVDEVRQAIEVAERNAEWVILVFHDLVATPAEVTQNSDVLMSDFDAMVRLLREPGRTVQVRRVSDVIGGLPVAAP